MHPDQQPNYNLPIDSNTPASKEPVNRARLIAGVGAGLVALAAAGTVGYLIGHSQTGHSTQAALPSTTTASSYSAVTTTTSAPAQRLSAADFSLAVTILDQKCFGSAGCITKYTLDPTYNGSSADLKGRSIRVIYRVEGGDDPQIGNFTLNGTTASISESTTIDTPNGATLTATVTSVIEN